MNNAMQYLGESDDYWLTLKRKADALNLESLIREIATLHAKVGYYERRLDEIQHFRQGLDLFGK